MITYCFRRLIEHIPTKLTRFDGKNPEHKLGRGKKLDNLIGKFSTMIVTFEKSFKNKLPFEKNCSQWQKKFVKKFFPF